MNWPAMEVPAKFEDECHLETLMATPSAALCDELRAVDGVILVLGADGKMGPTLARMAKDAAPDKRVLAVARFSEPGLREALVSHEIETFTAELLEEPRVANVIFMAGRKFGSQGSEELTWEHRWLEG